MLYSQNLPWRHTLRHIHTSSSRVLRSSFHNSARSALRIPQPQAHHYVKSQTISSVSPILRTFATSVPRRREDTDKKASEEAEDGKSVESKKEVEEEVLDKAESVDAKSKSPDTIHSEKSSDGRGSSAGGGDSGNNDSSGNSSGGGGGGRKKKTTTNQALQKPTVPDVYPQVMAIPIAKRPLFPGFYKAITIRNPEVMAAIDAAMKMGQPYIGAFLLRDENADIDVIEKMSDVHEVGTFCQITSAFTVQGDEPSMTAVLYPHRRIKMSSLLAPNRDEGKEVATAEVAPEENKPVAAEPTEPAPEQDEKKGDVVASFEENSADAKAQSKDSKQVQQYEPASFLKNFKVSLVNVDNLLEESYDKKNPTIRALISEIVNVFKEIANMNHIFRDQISAFSMSANAGNVGENPAKLADFAAAVSSGEPNELQEALESLNMEDRLHKALLVLKKEHMNSQLQTKISKDVESKIQKRQREYFLMEQMRGIRRELGLESDGKDKLIENFKTKASKLTMPDAVRKVFDEEINKLAHIEPAASEFNVTRNYLDWLTQIPWGQRSVENFDIKHAVKVLDEDHHGLQDVKDRILEFIAVGKLRGTVEGKILFMVGPPGVGKTSIGKSIAKALNRQYYRFSVGGMSDVAEIKGHRRTYVGALPGRMIQALKKSQTENPLILIDEVDKLSRGYQGDPAAALLEMLDPEQNNSFLDHYLDVPVDLSKVLFVCTANMTDTVPRPLLDRMETIELSGYVADEKMAIAEKYLAPAAKELSGLKDVDVILEKDAIQELINKYCRESGVRNLKKQIEKVYRKAALKIIRDLGEEALPEEEALTTEGKAAKKESDKDDSDATATSDNIENETTEKPRVALKVPDHVKLRITKENLKDYVGPPVFTTDRLYETTPPGVALGLAWTNMGGAALYVESILENALSYSSKPGFERTGNLKQVMKESTQIAYSFSKGHLAREFPENRFFEHARIHLHCPEGAVQKDGPSAGITMATSLLSLALDQPLNPTISMTGELTVTGKVLRIGGLREKTVAARRAGAKTIIFPKDNLSDWLELPENIKEGMEGKPVEWYSDVFETVFPNIDHDAANSVWKKKLSKPPKSERDDNDDKD
ncbi:ATP-dependent protease La [Microthyrium microscopicum]|uniref:Lon protease homolog, mitochondrial n=1 Tax=Microthyrium microscopicum TaxID=703497 RepID=A0A6A6TWM5_9PEZI|nr:ATP-dependent protease La [Microthyrium microscopicum]